uniref:MARVEL domain-containing protein n=1 Tax=Ascaris lumbricoides TaxID=6252 RepID=A0A0M3HT76_ASCLU
LPLALALQGLREPSGTQSITVLYEFSCFQLSIFLGFILLCTLTTTVLIGASLVELEKPADFSNSSYPTVLVTAGEYSGSASLCCIALLFFVFCSKTRGASGQRKDSDNSKSASFAGGQQNTVNMGQRASTNCIRR